MSKNNSTVEVGDVVRICLDNLKGKGEHHLPEWVTPKMKKFDGVEAEVIRVVKLAPNASVYELDGVTNWKGMPYTWTREALLKIARISTGTFKEDSFIDLAGYAACGYEIASGNDAKVDDALMKATLSEYAPIEELAGYMGARD